MTWLEWLKLIFQGPPKIKDEKEPLPPLEDPEEPVFVPKPGDPDYPWTERDLAVFDLLKLIGSVEAPRGYDQMSGYAEAKVGKYELTKLTISAVQAIQKRALDKGSPSSAAGLYQMLFATLAEVTKKLAYDPFKTLYSPFVQDRMAWYLLERRGLIKFMNGTMAINDFANNLAKEWASLPVVTRIQGQKRIVNPGESFYAGDGLNRSHVTVQQIISALEKIKMASPTRKAVVSWPVGKVA